MADFSIAGGTGGTVTFSKPNKPRPQPTLQWPERVGSEHQMRAGASEAGELVQQHFGVDLTNATIPFTIPFATAAQVTALEAKWLDYPAPDLTVTLETGTTYTCKFKSFNAPKRTGPFGFFTIVGEFSVESSP